VTPLRRGIFPQSLDAKVSVVDAPVEFKLKPRRYLGD
jgi:hypothetical protein